MTIVVDPGHGGTARQGRSSSSGVVGPRGTEEKDVTWAIAERLAARLADVTLTRAQHDNKSLTERALVASRAAADVFVSIHANGGAPGRRGTETWVHASASPRSRALADAVHREILALGGEDGGVQRGRMATLDPSRLPQTTAACMVEVDYLSDLQGEARLRDPLELDRLADAIARGITAERGVLPFVIARALAFTEAELQTYLGVLDSTRKPERGTDSRNKAAEVVALWQQGHPAFILTLRRKLLLLQEAFLGVGSDETTLAALLGGATDAEHSEILRLCGTDLRDETSADFATSWLAPRASGATLASAARNAAIFDDENVLDLQRRFQANARAATRLNCILIVRDVAASVFGSDPATGTAVDTALRALSGLDIKMTRFGAELSALGLVSQTHELKFKHGNGTKEPTTLVASVWDAIIGDVGTTQGWHIFGMAPFDGYHSVTIVVERRADATFLYWADQWAIDPGDDFGQESNSVDGFRRYLRAGFDGFIEEFTKSRWNKVLADKGKKYKASCHVWKLKSRP